MSQSPRKEPIPWFKMWFWSFVVLCIAVMLMGTLGVLGWVAALVVICVWVAILDHWWESLGR